MPMMVAVQLQDADGNTLGTTAHPLRLSEAPVEASGRPATATVMVMHIVDENGMVLGGDQNPLVVTIGKAEAPAEPVEAEEPKAAA